MHSVNLPLKVVAALALCLLLTAATRPANADKTTPKFETDPTRLIGVGYDRNGDMLDPNVIAQKLKAAHLNATSVGLFGHDSADPHDLAAARRWLTPWLAAMRARGIVTLVTITGTGGPDGGLSRPEFSDDWYTSCLNLLIDLGTDGVIVCPVAEGCIKEAAHDPTRAKILRWYNITAKKWKGMKGWNFQPCPSRDQVPPGWIGIVHPQFHHNGYPGCLILTDAPMHPRYKTGRYPNEKIIAPKLTALVRLFRARHMGYIEWGTWERPEIDEVAIAAVSAALTPVTHE